MANNLKDNVFISMQKTSSNKIFYWIFGTVFLLLVLIGGYIWHNSQATTNDTTTLSSSPTSTVRHDNSGAGANTNDNPVQEHFNRAMQHLGL